jgi:L-alanine-DL-glutamate epimerase-like enolase superfamily enzyme
MKIARVDAYWLSCPLVEKEQHVSDFGRQRTFDTAVVRIETADGLAGWGEAKPAVGSTGGAAAIVSCIEHNFRDNLIGQDARHISRLWQTLYCGKRAELALAHGRAFPALGRRGLSIAALSGVDTALWDLLGKSLGVPVVQLLGGPCRETMPVYASGGWADAAGIGSQLRGYVEKGFRAVKMRVGAMDGRVERSIERVRAAREGLGPDIELMCDAHGTMSAAEAKRFCHALEECNLRWFEEPCSMDDLAATAEVRASTAVPIALGESCFTRFELRDAIDRRAADILQPDAAIVGGISECLRVAHLCEAYQLELAPHLWGSALSFMAGLHVAFASPAARVIEYSLGGNPLLREMAMESFEPADGVFRAPTAPGLGVTPRPEFIEEHDALRKRHR